MFVPPTCKLIAILGILSYHVHIQTKQTLVNNLIVIYVLLLLLCIYISYVFFRAETFLYVRRPLKLNARHSPFFNHLYSMYIIIKLSYTILCFVSRLFNLHL